MKLLFSLFLFIFFQNPTPLWLTDMEKAKAEASRSDKHILINFSGSDWCVPCIRMHKDIFESAAFEKYADNNLVLVNIDFPRLKKNKLSKEQTRKNELLADKYNPHGSFPLTILTDANGKTLKQWEGFPNEKPEEFISEIESVFHTAMR